MTSPEVLTRVLEDIGVNNQQVCYGVVDEKIEQYLAELAIDDEKYERFMDFLRLVRMPLKAVIKKDVVLDLVESLKSCFNLRLTTIPKLQNILYYASTIDESLVALQRRSFSL
jgi:hypothetical protein